MRLEKRYAYVLAVLGLGSFAGAVHAQEGWLGTTAVAPFPDLDDARGPASAPSMSDSEISEGADLNRLLGSRRSPRDRATAGRELLPNPYGSNDDTRLTPDDTHGFDVRREETYSDERWSNPYAVARNTSGEHWSNPYVAVKKTQTDERWFNPYVAVKDTQTDERWSNPYGPALEH